jgi:hypothetical protein
LILVQVSPGTIFYWSASFVLIQKFVNEILLPRQLLSVKGGSATGCRNFIVKRNSLESNLTLCAVAAAAAVCLDFFFISLFPRARLLT